MKVTIFISGCLMILSITCSTFFPGNASSNHIPVASPPEIQVTTRESRLNERTPTSWKTREIMLGGRPSLKAVYFSDEQHGWIGAAGATLYKTQNGGTNWQPITLDAQRDMNVQSIFFLNADTGWIVLQRPREPGGHSHEPRFAIMRTIDGGRTWQSQYEHSNVVVTQMIFSDEKSGWLTGIVYQGRGSYTYFILRTKDQGDHWEGVSDELKRVASNRLSSINEGVMGIASPETSTATVITSEFRLFRTLDQGKSWQPIGSLENEYSRPNVIRRVGLIEKGYFWSVGGSNSAHSGTRGVLFLQQDKDLWVKNILYDVFFQDAATPLENQFLAAGSAARLVQFLGVYHAKNEAIVLSSVDGGKNWEVVYRNPRVTSINSINMVSQSSAWAVGEGGLVVKLENDDEY